MTQIKRIRYSIHLLVQFQYLELISFFKFPPWTTTSYIIEISKLSKELEAENYKNSAILLAPNQYLVYTDSSELILGNEKANLLVKLGTKMDPVI
ncbi:hypothetical protein CJF31_00011188 [Rutstroemia sp. NJR-2017a BVV2]|nr:hypothetical protein CJF31_00011188 [Rutstroemia sp. NJR-2017a BVV2]